MIHEAEGVVQIAQRGIIFLVRERVKVRFCEIQSKELSIAGQPCQKTL